MEKLILDLFGPRFIRALSYGPSKKKLFSKFWKKSGGPVELFCMYLFYTTRGIFISEKKIRNSLEKLHRDLEKIILDLFGPRFIRALSYGPSKKKLFSKFWKELGGPVELFCMPLFYTTRGIFISEKKFRKLIGKLYKDLTKIILDLFGLYRTGLRKIIF